jgi:putative membrane protein
MSDLATPTVNLPPGKPTSERAALGGILVTSAGAVAFLLWLLYFHHPTPALARQWIFLPQLNALLNGLSAVALCVGLYFIKQKKWRAHRASMLAAFGFSSLFLVSYIVNHALRGDTPFPGVGTARTVYLCILASHVLCSIVALPMVLTTLLFALRGQFKAHRRLARVTFPIWLYVSVTGVVVFVFLKAYAY